MNYNPHKHHRRSIRIPGYDYSREGWYFVTICVENKLCMFGKIEQNDMVINHIGRIIDYYWRKLPVHFNNVELDQYQIMPNHFHGIIHIVRAKHSNATDAITCLNTNDNASPLQMPYGTKCGSLGAIIQNFKSVTSRKINGIHKSIDTRVWQRNYWEHVIRDDKDLKRIREYIINNPLKWEDDKYYL
jgi:putative transposase